MRSRDRITHSSMSSCANQLCFDWLRQQTPENSKIFEKNCKVVQLSCFPELDDQRKKPHIDIPFILAGLVWELHHDYAGSDHLLHLRSADPSFRNGRVVWELHVNRTCDRPSFGVTDAIIYDGREEKFFCGVCLTVSRGFLKEQRAQDRDSYDVFVTIYTQND